LLALEDWVIGSEAFLQKIALLAKPTGRRKSLSKRHSGFTPELIISQVANQFDVSLDAYVDFRCRSEHDATSISDTSLVWTPMSISVVVPKAERSRHCFAEN